ncbi:MAG: hypothetical protein D6725_16010 [Planctomycetota bacterium]|nr:MAG: hypothetical protein D6725_16010 [Planctomycetota bacterium]
MVAVIGRMCRGQRWTAAILVLLAVSVLLGMTQTAWAQAGAKPKQAGRAADGEQDEGIESLFASHRPVIVLAVPSVDTILARIRGAAELGGHPELKDLLADRLKSWNDLRGIDRGQPLGAMFRLAAPNGGTPGAIAFVPIVDQRSFIDTVIAISGRSVDEERKGPGTTAGKKESSEAPSQSRADVVLTGRGRPWHVLFQRSYAFLTQDESQLGELPDPAAIVKPLAERYDVGAKLDIQAIPVGFRETFLATAKANAQPGLQRRDNESEPEYEVRRAGVESTLATLEQFVREGNELRLGFRLLPDAGTMFAEFEMTAVADSALRKMLRGVATADSPFAGMNRLAAPLSVDVAWRMNESTRKVLSKAAEQAEQRLKAALAGNDAAAKTAGQARFEAIRPLLVALQKTIQRGDINAFAELEGEKSGAATFVAAVELVGADNAKNALAELLKLAGEGDDVKELELNVGSRRAVTIHRIKGTRMRKQDERLYGADASAYVGIGEGALWLAVGGERALPQLYDAIDRFVEGRGRKVKDYLPLRLVVRAKKWLPLTEEPKDDRGRRIREALANAAPGEDEIELQAAPTEEGLRFRLSAGRAFVTLLCRGLCEGIIRRQQL